ncbi:MAG: lipopolysaccharide biosynthesis protein [Anaerolineales bacterium]|nr:lipopolysaccharide biosynthesis protein [Anaerolineales bacterium]
MSEATQVNFTKAAVQGTTVRYLIFFSSKLLLFVSTAILARLLTKDDFGVVGFAVTTINFLDVISSLGVGPALIYHPESDRTSSTAFWANLAISFTICAVAWAIAPAMAIYFRDPRATDVIRILSLSYPISSIGDTYGSLLAKKLSFNRTFLPEFLRAMVKGFSSIGFAYAGFGAWSLIIGQICGEATATAVYYYSLSWRPSFLVDRQTLKSLLNYGVKYVGADIVSVILLNLDYVLVGRFLGAEALGVYTLAFKLPDLIVLQFARSLSSVIFPIYSKMRDIPGSMAKGYLMTTRYISLITVPLGLGLALVAEPFTHLVFTDKWIEAVPAIQGIAIYALLLSLSYNAGGAYKASGKPQINTWTGLFRLSLLFPALWWAVAVAKSIVAVSWAHALVALIGTTVYTYVAARMLEIPLIRVGGALAPALSSGALMAVVVFGYLQLTADANAWVQLIGGVLLGGIIYAASLWFFQREVITDALDIVKSLRKKKN